MSQIDHSSPLVSVLIVSYNAGDYLRATLDSLKAQSYNNIEILIWDNASSDHTREIIAQYQSEGMTLKLYTSELNIGPYAGLNKLLEQAQGDYIAIQDHDDIWHSEKLTQQIEFLQKNTQYVGCGTRTVMYYEQDQTFFNYLLGEKNFYTIHPSLVFRATQAFRYDEDMVYFSDAYSQKTRLCHGLKNIYNLDTPLTTHIIKAGYSNYTYSWFVCDKKHIQRIFDLHGKTSYAVMVLSYEIFRKFLVLLASFLPRSVFIYFDRLPYRLSGYDIAPIQEAQDPYVVEMRDRFLHISGSGKNQK